MDLATLSRDALEDRCAELDMLGRRVVRLCDAFEAALVEERARTVALADELVRLVGAHSREREQLLDVLAASTREVTDLRAKLEGTVR